MESVARKQRFGSFQITKVEEIKPQEWKQAVTQFVHDLKTGPQKKVVLARELRLFFDENIQVESVLNNLFVRTKG